MGDCSDLSFFVECVHCFIVDWLGFPSIVHNEYQYTLKSLAERYCCLENNVSPSAHSNILFICNIISVPCISCLCDGTIDPFEIADVAEGLSN